MTFPKLPGSTSLLYQQAVFSLNVKLNEKLLSVEEIGDYLPGAVMVQDLEVMKNVYMNKIGCEYLKQTSDELNELGPSYFELFFVQHELTAIFSQIDQLIKLGDPHGSRSYFQRVRPKNSTEYKWYLTASQLCNGITPQTAQSKGILSISLEAGSLFFAQQKLSAFMDEDRFIRNNYHKYSYLTLREKEIVKFISEGKSCRQISDLLFISMHTVHNHRKHINKKLEISSLSQMIKFAIAFRLI